MKFRLSTVLFVVQLIVLLLAIVLFAFGTARAQAKAGTGAPADSKGAAKIMNASAASPATEAERARFERLRAEGFEALYNLEYETARARFQEMARAFPDHPAGSQFLAASLWLAALNRSRRLQSGLYNSESFYAGAEDKPDPKIVEQFKEHTRQAKQLAEARLKRNPKDTEALYFLGATQGIKAAFAAAVERRFFFALRASSDAVDRHRELIKLDPKYHDAEVSIGMYDYIVGGLPAPVRLSVSLFGVRGSKKRGLATLERVAREGRWAKDDARTLLIPLYKRERRFKDAHNAARELAAKYPRNYLYRLEAADALVSQAAVEREGGNVQAAAEAEREAFSIFDSLLRDRAAGGAAPRQLDQIHYQYAEALATAGQSERAAREFLAAAGVAGAEANLATMARLRAAQSLDLAGRREEALAQYRAVLARPNVYDAHDEAKRGLKEPYRARQPKRGDDAKAEVKDEGSKGTQ